MKKVLCSALLFSVSLTVQAATIDNWQGDICRYEGEVLQQKAHGKGRLTCQDGRQYIGEFQNNQLHGKGRFIVPNHQEIYLPPFLMNSPKIRGMELEGTFKKGLADGKHKAFQQGKHVFNIRFTQGIMQEVQLIK